jgi:hypothetical protein
MPNYIASVKCGYFLVEFSIEVCRRSCRCRNLSDGESTGFLFNFRVVSFLEIWEEGEGVVFCVDICATTCCVCGDEVFSAI